MASIAEGRERLPGRIVLIYRRPALGRLVRQRAGQEALDPTS